MTPKEPNIAHNRNWHWRDGMYAYRPPSGAPDDDGDFQTVRDGYNPGSDWRPVVDHPATKGWMLHMLREATDNPTLCVVAHGKGWRVPALWPDTTWETEHGALMASLLVVWEAAP